MTPAHHCPIDIKQVSAYTSKVGSSPKAPLAILAAAEFAKDKPAIVQAAKDWRYYETIIITMHEREGAVLKEYKEGGSWREHYKTWRDACEPFGLTRRRIDQLIQEESESRKEFPVNESKVDSLVTVNIELDPLDGLLPPPPAPAPKPAAAPEPPKPPEPPKDKFGRAIPQRCLPLVERAAANLQPCISASSKLTGLFSTLSNDLKHPDPLFAFAHGHIQEGLDHARWLHHLLRDCKPDLVCPACDGNGKKCDVCLNTGMVSEYTWNHRIIGSLSGDPKLADKAKAIEKGKL